MSRPTPQTTAQSLLPVSVYLGLSHSLVLLFFFVFSFLALFYFIFLFLPFLVFFSPLTAHVPAERKQKKILSVSRWPKWPPSSKKANWAPAPARSPRKLPWKVCQFFRWKRVEQIHSHGSLLHVLDWKYLQTRGFASSVCSKVQSLRPRLPNCFSPTHHVSTRQTNFIFCLSIILTISATLGLLGVLPSLLRSITTPLASYGVVPV
jgi:hypothetical protein